MSILAEEALQITAGAVLKNEPQVVPRLVPVVELESVWAVQFVHDLNFINHLVHLVLLYSLDGHVFYLLLLAPLKDLRKLALADLFVDVVLVHG